MGEERLGAARAIGPDQDWDAVPVRIGDLGERGVEDADVVGGGVRAGVAWPEQPGQELPGVVQERQDRMVAEGGLERRRGLLLRRMAHHDAGVHVDHQPG